jgi:hypothetical protein
VSCLGWGDFANLVNADLAPSHMRRILWLFLLVAAACESAVAQNQSIDELRRLFEYDVSAPLDVKTVGIISRPVFEYTILLMQARSLDGLQRTSSFLPGGGDSQALSLVIGH